jgi:hypothetical protein
VANLQAEGYQQEQIYLVGNVMADTLLGKADRAAARGTLAELGLRPRQYGLVTLHRPASVDDPAVLGAAASARRKSPVAARSCYPRIPELSVSFTPPGSRPRYGSSRRPVISTSSRWRHCHGWS